MTAHGEYMGGIWNMKLNNKIKAITLTGSIVFTSMFSGCSMLSGFFAKAPELQANAPSIKMYESAQFDSMLIDVNGRTYAPYGGVDKYMSNESLKDCIGYVDDDKNCRLYTLAEDPFDNYIIEKNVNSFMNPEMFWRDISTIEDGIFTPEYIDSFEYEEWGRSGEYNEMKSFNIDVIYEAEDVNEIVMDYKINGDVEAGGGVRNLDYSTFKRGEVFNLSIEEISIYEKYDKNDPFDVEIKFTVMTKDGQSFDVEGTYTGTVKFGDHEEFTLTGNPVDGYRIS